MIAACSVPMRTGHARLSKQQKTAVIQSSPVVVCNARSGRSNFFSGLRSYDVYGMALALLSTMRLGFVHSLRSALCSGYGFGIISCNRAGSRLLLFRLLPSNLLKRHRRFLVSPPQSSRSLPGAPITRAVDTSESGEVRMRNHACQNSGVGIFVRH
jgi:hypothetical protein